MTRQSFLGGQEARNLIGAQWLNIIGSGTADPFRDILGADMRYLGGPPAHHPHHHHHRGGWGREQHWEREQRQPAPYAQPYAAPIAAPPYYQPAPAQSPYWMPPVVRDHRTYVRGDEMEGQWPFSIPPRNELVDRPGPTRADRVILPMSSGVNILPNTSAQITSRPQDVAFRPERVVIGSAGTDGGAADWIVNDVKVGNKSQFSQSGDVPGDLFAATTIDSFVSFATVQTAMDFVILVTYVGANEGGAPFYCAVLGTAAV